MKKTSKSEQPEDSNLGEKLLTALQETQDLLVPQERNVAKPPTLKVVLTHSSAQLPTRAREGDVGYDFYAIEDGRILPGQTAEIKTGLRIVIPEGYWLFMRPRSSQGRIGLVSGTGIVDNGYTGPLGYFLTNTSQQTWVYKKGDKVGQLLPIRMHDVSSVEEITEEDIPTTERGSGGFGSTGGASWVL